MSNKDLKNEILEEGTKAFDNLVSDPV